MDRIHVPLAPNAPPGRSATTGEAATLTKRVIMHHDHQGMTNRVTDDLPTLDNSTLEDCSAFLVCLNSRRFVVVRLGEPKDFWPVNGGWDKLRELKAGDEVIYKGDRTTVRALDVYR